MLPTSCPGLSAGWTLKEMMFRMSKQQTYIIVLLFMVTLAAAQTAIADPVNVELAERTPPADPGDLIPPTTTTTTTSTTTTLPTISRCPDGVVDAQTGSRDGYNYWSFDAQDICSDDAGNFGGGAASIYCFENPYVQQAGPQPADWEMVTQEIAGASLGINHTWYVKGSWDLFVAAVTGLAVNHPETCYICGCFRVVGCFAPGVKITMADGSLRNIEDVRAGDLVRNAMTGAPVKVAKVIEGPEALPLLRFGFDGTTVTTSQAHPVLTATGLKPANQLKKGDTVFDAQGHPHPLTILETLPLEEGQRVINIDLEAASSDADQRLMVSDGIITGDIVLQGLLKERK